MTSFSDHAVGLAWTQTWQILAVAIIAASLAWAIGKRHPHMSYLLWMLVLVKALTPPVFVGPISIFNWPAESSQATPAVEYSGQNGVAVDLPSAQATSSSPVGIARDASIVTGTSWTALLALLWTCGTLLVIAFHGVAHTLFRRRLGRASRDSEEELTAQVAAIAKRVGLRRPPRALITTLPTSPAVFGVRRPIIVLPESALDDELSHNLEAILAHELIHVRRRDPLHALLQLVAVSFWWWNPVVWFASRLATRERERCCDEEVLGTLGYPGEFYAQCMLDMLRAQARPVVASPALGLKALPVTRRRLESIMRPGKHFHPRTPRWLWAAAIVLGLALLPGGRAAEPPPSTPDTVAIESRPSGLDPPAKLPQLLCLTWQKDGIRSKGEPVPHTPWDVNGEVLTQRASDEILRQAVSFDVKRGAGWTSVLHVDSLPLPSTHGDNETDSVTYSDDQTDSLPPLYMVFRTDERIERCIVMPKVLTGAGPHYHGSSARYGDAGLNVSAVQPKRSFTLCEWPNRISLEIKYPIDNETTIKTITAITDEPVDIVPGVRWYLDPKLAFDRDTGGRAEGKTAAVLETVGRIVKHASYRARVYLREKEEPALNRFVAVRGSRPNLACLCATEAIDSKDEIERVEITCQHYRISRIDDVPLRLDLLPE